MFAKVNVLHPKQKQNAPKKWHPTLFTAKVSRASHLGAVGTAIEGLGPMEVPVGRHPVDRRSACPPEGEEVGSGTQLREGKWARNGIAGANPLQLHFKRLGDATPFAEVPWKKEESSRDRFPLKPTGENEKHVFLTKWKTVKLRFSAWFHGKLMESLVQSTHVRHTNTFEQARRRILWMGPRNPSISHHLRKPRKEFIPQRKYQQTMVSHGFP